MAITWREWVIGYVFAHQMVLAQNVQRNSRNWSEATRSWFEQKERAGKKWIKSWQFQHGPLGYLLPVSLVLFLVALRFNLIAELFRRTRLFLQLRSRKTVRTDPQLPWTRRNSLRRSGSLRNSMRMRASAERLAIRLASGNSSTRFALRSALVDAHFNLSSTHVSRRCPGRALRRGRYDRAHVTLENCAKAQIYSL